ncbi:AfsR/SARP family transcriptional regulator [Micromonospora chersina]|uniref:DNA-binding transcriptional activator of the SARP family n=1 Tax=Micromonospora chersina TaxID=47854 RepID=A0A1C6U909_9ACTN|nr:BTAD domain-containing putative transcriptional regulator [Micromonospora chersina]SCL50516.1 DNA-binding transcriptional activator of the SARP family [Micromonospora chersina]
MATIQVRLLGPVDVTEGDQARPVPGLRRKALLAALALHAGDAVHPDLLIDIVWDGTPPATAKNSLQRHISYLRRVLGGRTAIAVRPHGYVLDLPPEATDLHLAQRLIGESRHPAEPAERAVALRAALALWRGRPLADLAGLRWLDEQAERLAGLELSAREALLDARLALGEHASLVPELARLADEHPYHEQIHHRLMLALYRDGRQVDALAAYQRLRTTLATDLGVDPSPALCRLHAAILRQDAELAPPAMGEPCRVAGAPAGQPAPSGPVPAQLPMAVRGFAGRRPELARLDALLRAARTSRADQPGTLPIAVVSGTAGVGKTAFAVHWAHRVAGEFPDGQLYVDLRGFADHGCPVDPAAAIRGFLDAFGVPAQRIPVEPTAQAALYRSMLAGRRVLVVLDNARDAAQVRPLLPATPGCLVLVTSRTELTPLVVSEGADPLTLDLLSTQESRELLAGRLGADRLATDPGAVDDLIARCARLPLALAVVAARAVTRPDFPLATLTAELRRAAEEPDAALDPFDGGDLATDIRAVFSWSYRTLTTEAARLLRLLSLHAGPDIAAPAAASLAGRSAALVKPLLAELARAHLLGEVAPGRYACHDLLDRYAAELAHTHDDASDRQRARHRMLDHYLHTADGAARLLDPHRDPITDSTHEPGTVPTVLAGYAEALAWFRAERPVLLAAVAEATRTGSDRRAWQLAWTLLDFLDAHAYWHDLAAVQDLAMTAARRLGDRLGEAHAHWGLARARAKLGDHEDARRHFQRALELFELTGDRTSQAHTRLNLAWVLDRQGRYAEALPHAREALALYEALGHVAGQADGLNAIGWYLTHLGEHRQALGHCRRALDLHQRTGDRRRAAQAWDSLGHVHGNLGDHERATECYRNALALTRQLSIRYDETIVLTHLGSARRAAGDREEARAAWRHALAILEQLNHPDADVVRVQLAQLS